MARVYLEDISRRFATTMAIDHITFEVPDGEFWVLVGPSGCGKSTVLRTIAGLDSATSGNLYIGDRRVNQIPARQRDVAMVFQNYALYPHMTVAENLAFGLRMRQAEPKVIQTRVETVAQSLNIAHLLDRKPRQLSGGQQQRVALGRAIARQPQVFLLDEPLSNLDAQLRDDTRTELKQLHQQFGITTLYVTHDQVEAMTLADRIVVLNQGRIQQIADPQTIYARPANQMVATFLGNPPMNILPVTYNESYFHLTDHLLRQVNLREADVGIPCPEWLQNHLTSGQRLNLGIRPEQVEIAGDRPCHLLVEIVVVEPLGRETLVRTRLAMSEAPAISVNVQVAADMRLKVGDRLPLYLNLDHVVAFDPATQNNLQCS